MDSRIIVILYKNIDLLMIERLSSQKKPQNFQVSICFKNI